VPYALRCGAATWLLYKGLGVFEPNQRVKVNLSGLTINGVAFSQNVQEALGTVIQRTAAEPATYLIELLFSFKGVKRVEVPEERIRRVALLEGWN